MTRPTDLRVCRVASWLERLPYRAPMKFGGRVVTEAVLFNVEVEVETRQGRRGKGKGSMPLSNAWAWPSQAVGGEQTLAAMIALAERLIRDLGEYQGQAHPLEISRDLSASHSAHASQVQQTLGLAEPPPRLAVLVCASPLDAALHDALGKTLGRSSYQLLGSDFLSSDLASLLGSDFAGESLDRYVLGQPRARMPLYHLVGALDPLSPAELPQRLGDGLPETLGEWILADGLTHLKIKLAGDQLDWDVDRVLGVDRAATAAQAARGCAQWCYSLDFNERCASVEYVLEFLRRLAEQAPQALDRVQYIEQPTHRDLHAHPENQMHEAARIKPVVIDESLVDLESLLLARQLGYSGVALKACKGHGEALLMGAAAQKYGLFLCVQDLTCPGASFLHSASLAAHVPTVAAIEGNARQYCPQGNRGWATAYPSLFEIHDGTVGTEALCEPGLGFTWLSDLSGAS